jgi:hypothetical protein
MEGLSERYGVGDFGFAAGFDASFTLRHQLSELLGREIRLMLTDSKSPFDIIITQKRTTEHRLMIDIFAARQVHRRREIDNIGLIRSEFNLADDLTKLLGNGAFFCERCNLVASSIPLRTSSSDLRICLFDFLSARMLFAYWVFASCYFCVFFVS